MERPNLRDIKDIKRDIKNQSEKIEEWQPEITQLVRKGNYGIKAQLEHAHFNSAESWLRERERELIYTKYILFLEKKLSEK